MKMYKNFMSSLILFFSNAVNNITNINTWNLKCYMAQIWYQYVRHIENILPARHTR